MRVTPEFRANSAKMWNIVEKNESKYPNSLFLFSNKNLVKDAFSYLDNSDKSQTAKTLQDILKSMSNSVLSTKQMESTLAFAEDIFSKMRQIAAKAGEV